MFYQPPVPDKPGLDDLRQTVQALPGGEGGQKLRVDDHQAGLMEGPQEVFAFGEIDGGFAADAGVHHGEQRGGHLHQGNAPHVNRGQKARDIPHHPAPQRDEAGAPVGALGQEFFGQPLDYAPVLGPLPPGHGEEGGLKA